MSGQKKVRLVVTGCCGRMGSLIIEEAARHPQYELAGAVEHAGHPQLGQKLGGVKVGADLRRALAGAGLLIEFTTPEASVENVRIAAEAGVPVVLGTTGFTPEQLKALQESAKRVQVFWSPNMSIGIVIVRRLILAVSRLLFDFGLTEKTKVRISETHHTRKKDRPSGTAKALAEELLKATGWLIKDEEIEAKREGDVIGIHSVTFDCGSEQITLGHEAVDRRVFAQGALIVGSHLQQLTGGKPGWYGMDDFINAMHGVAHK